MGNGFLHGKGGAVLTGSPVSAGYCYLVYDTTPAGTATYNTYVKLKEVKVKFAGVYKVTFVMAGAVSGVFSVYCDIYKNGTSIGYEIQNTTAYTNLTYSQNVNLAANDLIQIYGKHTWSGATPNIINEFGIGIAISPDTKYIAEQQSV